MDQAQHRKGFLITLFGVLVLTPDSLLVYLVNIEPLAMSFWRGLLQGVVISLALLVLYRKQFWPRVKSIGKTGVIASASFAICNICFVYSLAKTGAANTLILVATTSMWAALLSMIILKERVKTATFIAMTISFIGILVIFIDDLKSGNLLDNLFGLTTAIGMALGFTLIRTKPNVNMLPTSGLSAFMIAIVTIPFVGTIDYSVTQWGTLLLLGLFVLPVSFGCMSIGPRYIPSSEVSLLLLLETTLGPLWVWLGIGTAPHINEIIGGAIVITALAGHSLHRLKQNGQRRKKAAALA